MTLQHPTYLALLLLFLGIGVWAAKRRQRVRIPDGRQFTRSGLFSRAVIASVLLGLVAVSAVLIVALANPVTEETTSYVSVETKVCAVSVDASTSMGRGPQSTMEKIRAMLHDFVHRRLERGDYIGITAYSGQSSNSRGWGYARIIMYPTVDPVLVHGAVDSVQATMFGAYTAIGDGIFVSLVALIEPEARKAMGEEYDRMRLEDSVWSLDEDDEDISYAQEVADAVGDQKGKYVILFTDGKYNTGMHPAKALWFAQRLGIKTHFIAFDSTSSTGLSYEDQLKHKQETIEAVRKTGGMYRESADVEGIARLLEEVDSAEKAKISVESEPRRESKRQDLFRLAAILFTASIVVWIAWGDKL